MTRHCDVITGGRGFTITHKKNAVDKMEVGYDLVPGRYGLQQQVSDVTSGGGPRGVRRGLFDLIESELVDDEPQNDARGFEPTQCDNQKPWSKEGWNRLKITTTTIITTTVQ